MRGLVRRQFAIGRQFGLRRRFARRRQFAVVLAGLVALLIAAPFGAAAYGDSDGSARAVAVGQGADGGASRGASSRACCWCSPATSTARTGRVRRCRGTS